MPEKDATLNEVFEEIADKSGTEFFLELPKNYKKGQTKYVVITGSVMSGIGKGMISSSLCKLLKDREINVEPMKLEAYLNVDSGTLNPFRHGEVFVLDDGTETDMDLGSYERFADKNLSKNNFVTSGRIYQEVIRKERAGEYLGRDVQFIPHVTAEIKNVVRKLALEKKADIVLIEIGGTVGDYENLFALEAMRELAYEDGKQNVCFVNVTYIIEPKTLGEHKSKAAQFGIRQLMQTGIQPDVIICRSETKIPERIKEKISMSSNVHLSNIVGCENIGNIYELPLAMRERNLDEIVLETLEWNKKFPMTGTGNKKLYEWTEKNKPKENAEKIKIGIAGKYTGSSDTYISILKAVEHCEGPGNAKIEIEWIDTEKIEARDKNELQKLDQVKGIIVPGGFGSRGTKGKIEVIKYCREQKKPFLGLCFGFQHALIEFARNVLGYADANTTEIDLKTKHPVVDLLPEQKQIEGLGGNMRLGGQDVEVKEGSIAWELYGKQKHVRERFRHRYECNPEYIQEFEQNGIIFSGKHSKYPIMQILELSKKEHPYFLAVQYHPEFTSRPLKPNPCYLGFINACKKAQ
ncbi:MAG: CTP synthase [Candidatus Diapherotrites archaeon]|nr:CTP synthase [Candidatus Diapherotrites archaeon]